MKPSTTVIVLVSSSLFVACGGEPLDPAEDDVEEVGESADALSTDNALNANALNANALYPNALNANALNANALNANALNPNALSAIKDPGAAGSLSRQYLKYIVSCALSKDQSFKFSWTDSQNVVHAESYPGWLALEPAWATNPLTANGQRIISACLASRVNWYGTQVIISARSVIEPLKTLVGSQELADYPDIEGAFWGNLFSATPYVNACFNEANVANSRANKRDCAVGHLNPDGTTSQCGMIKILGGCKSVCSKINGAGQYYQDCVDRPGVSAATTKAVVTTALP